MSYSPACVSPIMQRSAMARSIPCGGTVHGGAVQTCLDEATAECARSKLFPMATTSKIEFKINKPVLSNVTYRVYCKVERQRVKNVLYEVSGILTGARTLCATCLALMANPSEVEKQTPRSFMLVAVEVVVPKTRGEQMF